MAIIVAKLNHEIILIRKPLSFLKKNPQKNNNNKKNIYVG